MYRIQKDKHGDKFENNFDGVDQLKQQLINNIYNSVDLSRFKYELLEVEPELSQLVERKYFVSANFSGSNCLLVFAKIRDKYHSFLVDRKTLSYNSQKVNLSNVKLLSVKVKLDLEIYNGSIFDGILIQGKNEKTFVITDVYTFKGTDLSKSQLDSKLLTIITYLKSNYDQNDKDNDLTITINRLYSLEETEHVVKNVIPKIGKGFSVRGICFYPEVSGTKLIFLFGNEARKDVKDGNMFNMNTNTTTHNNKSQDQNDEIKDQQIIVPEIKKVNKIIYSPKKGKKDESYVFEMKKTENVDVYILNAVEPVTKGKKTYLKRKKVCLAFIPDVSRSTWCKESMENTDGNILVNCKYHADKKKWEPILISASKRPSSIDDFDAVSIE